jgi:hypothetical protein
VQGNAEDRLRRASNTRTRPAGQLLELQQGDKVDIYRDPPNKDLTGWRGPGEVESLRRLDEGLIDVRWQGRILPCRVPDVRRSVIWLTFLTHVIRGDDKPFRRVALAMEHLQEGSMVLYGGERGEDRLWKLTPASKRQPELLDAIMNWGKYGLHLTGIVAARLGHGTREIPPTRSATWSVVYWWPRGRSEEWHHCYFDPIRK